MQEDSGGGSTLSGLIDAPEDDKGTPICGTPPRSRIPPQRASTGELPPHTGLAPVEVAVSCFNAEAYHGTNRLHSRGVPLHRRTGAFHTRGFYDIMLIHPEDEHIFSTMDIPIHSISAGAVVDSLVKGVLI